MLSRVPNPRAFAVIVTFASTVGIILSLASESWFALPIAILGWLAGTLVAVQAINSALTEVKKPEDAPEGVPTDLSALGAGADQPRQ